MIARLALVACAGLVATATAAQVVDNPGQGSEDVILGAWSDPAKCNHGNARSLTFDDVLAGGKRLNGACVAVEGFWAGRALFKRASQGDTARSNVVSSLRRHRIGIYAREELLENAPKRSMRYTMVGIIGQCETEWPEAMMILGYCHYASGPILKVAEAVPLRSTTER